MNRPYMNMSEPDEGDYKKRTREISLYSYYEHFDPEGDHEMDEEEKENHRSDFLTNGKKNGVDHWWSGYRDQPKPLKIAPSHVTLQTILDLLPKGVNPSDVKIRFTIDYGDMGVYGQEISFYYKANLPAEPEEFKKDMAIWQKLHDEYEVKEAAYEKWEKEQQIKELESRITKLKK